VALPTTHCLAVRAVDLTGCGGRLRGSSDKPTDLGCVSAAAVDVLFSCFWQRCEFEPRVQASSRRTLEQLELTDPSVQVAAELQRATAMATRVEMMSATSSLLSARMEEQLRWREQYLSLASQLEQATEAMQADIVESKVNSSTKAARSDARLEVEEDNNSLRTELQESIDRNAKLQEQLDAARIKITLMEPMNERCKLLEARLAEALAELARARLEVSRSQAAAMTIGGLNTRIPLAVSSDSSAVRLRSLMCSDIGHRRCCLRRDWL